MILSENIRNRGFKITISMQKVIKIFPDDLSLYMDESL
jgi:hypothetical protein